MAYKTSHDGRQRIMNRLAESVFQLSDEEILAEVLESGFDPQEEADSCSLALRQAVDTWESENKRLSNLGHTINPNHWLCVDGIYHNHCVCCGSPVSFTAATGEMQGAALNRQCPESDQYAIRKQEASR